MTGHLFAFTNSGRGQMSAVLMYSPSTTMNFLVTRALRGFCRKNKQTARWLQRMQTGQHWTRTLQRCTDLLVLQLLLLQQPLQILHVVVFKVFDEATGGLQTFLYRETGCFIPEHKAPCTNDVSRGCLEPR